METLEELQHIVDHQATLEGLWLNDRSATPIESLLMAALRHLHAVIEGDKDTAEKCAEIYWEMDL